MRLNIKMKIWNYGSHPWPNYYLPAIRSIGLNEYDRSGYALQAYKEICNMNNTKINTVDNLIIWNDCQLDHGPYLTNCIESQAKFIEMPGRTSGRWWPSSTFAELALTSLPQLPFCRAFHLRATFPTLPCIVGSVWSQSRRTHIDCLWCEFHPSG